MIGWFSTGTYVFSCCVCSVHVHIYSGDQLVQYRYIRFYAALLVHYLYILGSVGKYPVYSCSCLFCSYLHILYMSENYILSPINQSVYFQWEVCIYENRVVVRNNIDPKLEEQRSVWKFLLLENEKPSHIFQRLLKSLFLSLDIPLNLL